ncbi:MAG: hypothetical protein DMD53_05550 [Gemmatimonadetes bacterium]|nr:MAG: hypothetical protein DMD53_05550 [Gemmatimonadota bacterium]
MYCSRCGTQNENASKFCRSCGLDLTATTPVGAVKDPQQEMTDLELVREQLKEEYEILEELGRGGMAIVFRARERQLERDVAIKVLPFSLSFDKEFVERFQREARTSAKLEHPNIIPIYRVGKSGRVIFFVMKFLRGKPLSSVLAARGTLAPAEIRQVLAQVARALAYAHRSGIVHRDIKPDNIMFDEHGLAMVTDFGIAKAATGGKLTGTGMSIGTPHYMSPEQARAQPLDGRSDLYSLGVVAYQCLAGSVPFDGEDSFAIGYKHIMEELPTPSLETPDKRSLFDIIRKMMAKLPDDRFQDADDLVQALEGGAFAPLALATAPTRAIPSLGKLTAAPTPLPKAGRPVAPGEHHRSVAAAVSIWLFIVLSLAGGGGFYAYKKGWLLATPGPATGARDSTARDTSAAADSAGRADTSGALASATGGGTGHDTSRSHQPPPSPGTPARLTLQGVPQGARVTLNGQPVRGPQVDVPPGVYKLAVRAGGYQPYERQVVVPPGAPLTVRVELQAMVEDAESGGGPCDAYGPAYNQDKICFDTRPIPLQPALVPVPGDAPVFPRPAILLFHVSRNGETQEVRVFVRSNVETFNDQALDLAKNLRWNPALKNGEPVDAWVQYPVNPTRQ